MEKAMAAITAQQERLKPRTAPWVVGEQLKDMLRREPGLAELITQDLTTGGMTLAGAEARIKDYADKHKVGRCACVSPTEAEEIIRGYFGLPQAAEPTAEPEKPGGEGVIDLADFF